MANDLWAPAYDFIKQKEGFAPVAKWDYQQYSGGYGSRAKPGEVFDRNKADAYLRRDMAPVTSFLDKNVTVPLTDNQRAALVSFGYNLGTGKGGLSDLIPSINASNWQAVANQMQRYNHAGGAVNDALTARRREEGNLVLNAQEMPPMGGVPAAPASPQSVAAAGPGVPEAPQSESPPATSAQPLSLAGLLTGGQQAALGGTGAAVGPQGLQLPGGLTFGAGTVRAPLGGQQQADAAPEQQPLSMAGVQTRRAAFNPQTLSQQLQLIGLRGIV